MSAGPPPLPSKATSYGESPFMTYGRAVAILLPGIFALVFAQIVMMPKLEASWRVVEDDSKGSKLDTYFMGPLSSLESWYLPFIISGIFLFFTALELGWKSWRHWRSLAMTLILVVFNIALLIAIVSIAVVALVLGPAAGKALAKKSMQNPVPQIQKPEPH